MQRALCAFLCLLGGCCFSLAQTPNATVSGRVLDPSGAVVPGVRVLIVNDATNVGYSGITNEVGIYSISFLPPAKYHIQISKDGFKNIIKPNVILNVQDAATINFALEIGPASQSVTVESGAPMINTETAAVSTMVDRQFVENIPLNGRSFQSLITLTPGVTVVPSGNANTEGQFSVNGQRAGANSFIVDGVSTNFGANGISGGSVLGGNLPGLTTFGTTQSLVSVDALQEFRVQTSSYSAEYGRQPGGQISIATRSGTNQFHGSAFDYLRNDVFDANDWFANRAGQRKPPERQNDFGGALGGPIMIPHLYNGRDRTFFFFSYEGLRLRLPQFGLTNVPTLALRQQASAGLQPILNAFPLPNGRDLGNGLAEFSAGYSDPSSLDATSVRIDHLVNDRLTLFGRYNRAPSETSTRSAGISLSNVQSTYIKTDTITLGGTASLTPRLAADLRVNYTDNNATFVATQDDFGGAISPARSSLILTQYDSSSAQGQVNLAIPGMTSTSRPQVDLAGPFQGSQRQLNAVSNLSYAIGSHRLKFGVDYRRLTPVFAQNAYLLTVAFFSLQEVLRSSASSGFVQAQIVARPIFVNFSAYGQDTWRLSRRLTLDFGLRWEVNPAPRSASGNDPFAVTQIANLSTMQLAPRGTPQWKTTYNGFAPRVGIAYQVGRQPGHEAVLRGGFGVFYDTGNDNGANQFLNFPFSAGTGVSNVGFPLSAAQVAPPVIPASLSTLTPPYGFLAALFDPALKLPYTLQWNVAVERSLGKNQALTVSYVGAAGRRLLQSTQLRLTGINPIFTNVRLNRSSATSDYDALQAQFQRRFAQGLQALVSYTWAHALDEDSASNTARVAQRGNASFDIRHVLGAAITYDIPAPRNTLLGRTIIAHWSIDATVHAQSALPVDLVARTQTDPTDGSLSNVRPNVVPTIPFYISGTFPGGRAINNTVGDITPAQATAAGCVAPTPTNATGPFCTPLPGSRGNFGRNQVRGLGAWQLDFALRREFPLHESLKLQFRAEAFNTFNHPNFGTVQTTLTAANFGQATNMLNRQLGGISQLYQIGGPRSLQLALRLSF